MLNFELDREEDGRRTRLTMTARFRPKGLLGILYWYAVLPLHNIVFGGMLRGIRNTAEATDRPTISSGSSQCSLHFRQFRGDGARIDYGVARMHFFKESRIAAAPEFVFRFHESPGLRHLIPPWEKMELVESSSSLSPAAGFC